MVQFVIGGAPAVVSLALIVYFIKKHHCVLKVWG
jgi:hypothetical protein